MLLKTLFLSFMLNVFGQRYPQYFDKQNSQFHQYRQMLPKPKNDRYDTRALYEELDELDDRLNKNNKWEEFKEMATRLKEKGEKNPDHDWHDDLRKVLEWSRSLTKDKPAYDEPIERSVPRPKVRPSPGMGPYWNDEYDQVPSKSRNLPHPGPNTPRFLSGKQALNAALRKLEESNMDGINTPKEDINKKILPENLKKEQNANEPSPKSLFPKEDDFKAPIKWVPLDSNDTHDGLAKVTDPKTGRNLNFVINGTLMVPVIDYSLERLGLSTTTSLPLLTTDGRTALRTVIRNVDLQKADESDWLIFETAFGGRNDSNECSGDGCQARCKRLGCESSCNGDTCASGCVGGHCSTFCKGPGCLSMCIGEDCSAKCVGISCEARCLGGGCEAGCRSFSCQYAVNGKRNLGGGAWGEHYPQYDTANIKPDY